MLIMLTGKSMSKMRIVNIVCILGCMLIYLLIGSGGYVLLGQNTPDDILKGICGDGAYFNRSGAHNDGCCMADNATHNATHNGTHPNYLNEHFGNEGYHDNYYGGVGYGNKTPSPPDDTMCSSHLMVTVALARFCVLIKVACSFGMIVFVVRVVSFVFIATPCGVQDTVQRTTLLNTFLLSHRQSTHLVL